jgi:hypothetical protein
MPMIALCGHETLKACEAALEKKDQERKTKGSLVHWACLPDTVDPGTK